MWPILAVSFGKARDRFAFVGLIILLAGFWPVGIAQAQTPFPLQQGEAAATTFSGLKQYGPSIGTPNPDPSIDPNGRVVTTLDIDIRNPNPPGAILGEAWLSAPFYQHSDQNPTWIAANLGQVFGIALDDDTPPNIYVTASSVYVLHVNAAKTDFEPGMYGTDNNRFRTPHPGAIYRLDGTTGAICLYAILPNSGSGLGNIAYDRAHSQFFVSNFEDGLIYRIPKASPRFIFCSQVLPTGTPFDHGQALPTAVPPRLAIPDTHTPFDFNAIGPFPSHPLVTPGFTPRGRRVWGLQVFDNRLYYSVWATDTRDAGTKPSPNEIWSVPIDRDGSLTTAFSPVRLEKTIPSLSGLDYSNPVSDIAFSSKGKMLVAERVRHRDYGIHPFDSTEYTASPFLDAHAARLLEFSVGGSTIEPPKVIYVGNIVYQRRQHENSSGGADYGYGYSGSTVTCDDTIAAMGDALRVPGQNPPGFQPNDQLRVYGLQLGPASGNSPNDPLLPDSVGVSSYFINLGPKGLPGCPQGGPPCLEADYHMKTEIGDVAVARESCTPSSPSCLSVSESVLCTTDGSKDYVYSFHVTNLSTSNVTHLLFVDLPSPATVTSNDVSFVSEPGGFLAPGKTSQLKTVRIHHASPGSFTFRFLAYDQSGSVCCSVSHALDLPACNCAQVLSDGAVCSQAGGYDYTLTIQNLTSPPQPPISYVLLTATTPGLTITQSGAPIRPLLNFGDVTTQTINFAGDAAKPGGTVCFQVGIHDTTLNNCCTIDRCFGPLFSCRPQPAQSDLNLSLNTGLGSAQAASTGGTLAATADPGWTVILPRPVRPAQAVSAPDSDWPWSIPGSAWISRDPSAASTVSSSAIRYRRCFCIGTGAKEAKLDLAVWADHQASLLLNGVRIAGPGGNYDGVKPLSVHMKGAVGHGGPFAVGTNCLVAVVNESGDTTGLDVFGSVQAVDGACTSP